MRQLWERARNAVAPITKAQLVLAYVAKGRPLLCLKNAILPYLAPTLPGHAGRLPAASPNPTSARTDRMLQGSAAATLPRRGPHARSPRPYPKAQDPAPQPSRPPSAIAIACASSCSTCATPGNADQLPCPIHDLDLHLHLDLHDPTEHQLL